MDPILIVVIVLSILMLFLLIKGLKQVRQAEVIIIERLGRYKKTLQSGLRYIVPLFDKSRNIIWKVPMQDASGRTYYITKESPRVDLRETILDFPSQNVITKDNVNIEIDALIYFQITDPVKAVYEINNLPDAIEKLTQTTLRNVLGGMELDESLSSRDFINDKLRIILDEATDKWGVKVNRVELKDISPSEDIRDAMEKQMKAERRKRADILEAEGKKQAAVLKAQGEQEAKVTRAKGQKEASVLKAQGIAEAKKITAEAEAEAIKSIIETTIGQNSEEYKNAINYIIALKYIESLKDISSGKDTKTVFMPYEASGVIGSIGSVKELFGANNINKNIENSTNE